MNEVASVRHKGMGDTSMNEIALVRRKGHECMNEVASVIHKDRAGVGGRRVVWVMRSLRTATTRSDTWHLALGVQERRVRV